MKMILQNTCLIFSQNIFPASGAQVQTRSYPIETLSNSCSDSVPHRKISKRKQFALIAFSKELIIEFLDWLENERNCSISTRNQRLAAIHAFLHYVQSEHPESLF